jgi:hypothetical protein
MVMWPRRMERWWPAHALSLAQGWRHWRRRHRQPRRPAPWRRRNPKPYCRPHGGAALGAVIFQSACPPRQERTWKRWEGAQLMSSSAPLPLQGCLWIGQLYPVAFSNATYRHISNQWQLLLLLLLLTHMFVFRHPDSWASNTSMAC